MSYEYYEHDEEDEELEEDIFDDTSMFRVGCSIQWSEFATSWTPETYEKDVQREQVHPTESKYLKANLMNFRKKKKLQRGIQSLTLHFSTKSF